MNTFFFSHRRFESLKDVAVASMREISYPTSEGPGTIFDLVQPA